MSAVLDPDDLLIDTEWAYRDDCIDHESAWVPVVLCAINPRTGDRHSFWGDDPDLSHFFRDHAGDNFIAHNAVEEMKYLLRLGIPLPANWFDTFVAVRYCTNRPHHLEAGLAVTLVRMGLPGLAPAEKEELQQRILHLRFDPDSSADRREITDYCFSDCDGTARCSFAATVSAAPGPSTRQTSWLRPILAGPSVASCHTPSPPIRRMRQATLLDTTRRRAV